MGCIWRVADEKRGQRNIDQRGKRIAKMMKYHKSKGDENFVKEGLSFDNGML